MPDSLPDDAPKVAQDGWREKMMPAEKIVEEYLGSNQKIWTGGWTTVPTTLCDAIARNSSALTGSEIHTFLTPFDWDRPEILEHLKIFSGYAGPLERQPIREGRFDYVPVVRWRTHQMPPGMDGPYDAALIPISPPDEQGWCSFHGGIWFGKSVQTVAKSLLGEVHPEAIRTGGENRVRIDAFAAVTEFKPPANSGAPPIPPRSEETEQAAQVICALVSTEILRDGATVQIGIGDVSAAMPVYFDHLHDLGIQTEIIPGGIADLVDKGVVTGRFKELRPGKVVGTAFVQLPPEEVARVDGNDTYELYDFTYTDDLTNLLTLRNFYAINNALAVDVTGNVSSESMGPQIFSGPGGQTVFAVAAATVNAGSVIVLPSSEVLKTGERVSRIVPALEAGTTITVHRAYVDYVVTEQGIARLTGKSIRQRIDELLAVSHPDLRPQLREEVQRLYAGRASNAKN